MLCAERSPPRRKYAPMSFFWADLIEFRRFVTWVKTISRRPPRPPRPRAPHTRGPPPGPPPPPGPRELTPGAPFRAPGDPPGDEGPEKVPPPPVSQEGVQEVLGR